MASCDYCNSYILFGGSRQAGRTFCNDTCLKEGRLLLAADRLPQHVVDGEVNEVHQGNCPLCEGSGPVDVHMSHTVWSIIAMTSWRSTPNICCRSCGRQKQLCGLLTSSLFGWWGLPWGLIHTPLQIWRNISGITGGPDPEFPSEQLENLIRLDIAARAEAGEPMPGGRNQTATRCQQAVQADDSISVECEECGRQFKAKAAMAGRSGKCPGCGSRITVPEADEWLNEDEYEVQDEWDDGDDVYEDYGTCEDDWGDESSPRAQPRRTSSRMSAKKKAEPNPFRILIAVAIGFVLLSVAGVIVIVAVNTFRGNRRPRIAHNNPAPAVAPNAAQPGVNIPGFVQPVAAEFSSPSEQFTSAPGNPNADANAAMSNANTNSQPAGEISPVPPLKNSAPSGKLWAVLSNFRPSATQGLGSINKRYLIDYQLASGTPDASAEYVLHISKTLGAGTFQQYVDIPVQLGTSGTLQVSISPALSVGTDFVATIALKQDRQKWKHISGELSPGGDATVAQAPPTVREAAGTAAQGKLVAIANPQFETANGPFATLTVDFELLQPVATAGFYFMVAETPAGQKIEFDVARNLRQVAVGEESKFGGRLFGAGSQLKPPFTLHVEKRKSRFQSPIRPETPEIISNKVNVPG